MHILLQPLILGWAVPLALGSSIAGPRPCKCVAFCIDGGNGQFRVSFEEGLHRVHRIVPPGPGVGFLQKDEHVPRRLGQYVGYVLGSIDKAHDYDGIQVDSRVILVVEANPVQPLAFILAALVLGGDLVDLQAGRLFHQCLAFGVVLAQLGMSLGVDHLPSRILIINCSRLLEVFRLNEVRSKI